MQRNWIGRSEGAQFGFEVLEGCEARGQRIEVYTTRPDTIFGATYVVVAPEHPLARQLATEGQRVAVVSYVEAASRKSELERTELSKDKTGVWTGSFVKNPATGEAIPVWVAGESPQHWQLISPERLTQRSAWRQTMSWAATAAAPSWQFPRTTLGTSSLPRPSSWTSSRW